MRRAVKAGFEEPDENGGDIARSIINAINGQMSDCGDYCSILQEASEALAVATRADRCLVWQVSGDRLTCTNEVSASGSCSFVGTEFGESESRSIVLSLLMRCPEQSGLCAISIPDTREDESSCQESPTLSALFELGKVQSRLLVPLRVGGILYGFVEVNQCRRRDWSGKEIAILQSVAGAISQVVKQSVDQAKLNENTSELKLFSKIAAICRNSSRDDSTALGEAVGLAADHLGFKHAQFYLFDQSENALRPQLENGNQASVSLAVKDNPVVQVFKSGKGKVINAVATSKKDSVFEQDLALVVPLISQGEHLGAAAWWQRRPGSPQLSTSSKELGMAIATTLAQSVHIRKLKG